jgi:hypothetical protein
LGGRGWLFRGFASGPTWVAAGRPGFDEPFKGASLNAHGSTDVHDFDSAGGDGFVNGA